MNGVSCLRLRGQAYYVSAAVFSRIEYMRDVCHEPSAALFVRQSQMLSLAFAGLYPFQPVILVQQHQGLHRVAD
jgi:hypothetical protein